MPDDVMSDTHIRVEVSAEDMRLLPVFLKSEVPDAIFLPGDRLFPGEGAEAAARIHERGKKAYYAFPYILRGPSGEDILKLREEIVSAGWDGYLIRSLDEAGLCREMDLPGEKVFDAGLYTWNRRAAAVMRSFGADVLTLPVECSYEELSALDWENVSLIAYGKLPLMISAQCTRNTTGQCLKKMIRNRREREGTARFNGLEDRKRAVFSESSWCRYCYSVIYNSVPLWLLNRIPEGIPRIRFVFTDETPEQAEAVLFAWESGIAAPPASYTRGHFVRGVE